MVLDGGADVIDRSLAEEYVGQISRGACVLVTSQLQSDPEIFGSIDEVVSGYL
jgi:hypothetical protein